MTLRSKRVSEETAFVLHHYPYRETSLLIDVFTENYGRVRLIARGARRPRSEARGLLQAFQPLLLSWVGVSELKTLTKVEWQGGVIPPKRGALMSAFYLNELLIRALPNEDAHPVLFEHYKKAVSALGSASDMMVHAAALRRFEVAFLSELGYAMTLTREKTQNGKNAAEANPIVEDKRYHYFYEQGATLVTHESDTLIDAPIVRGKTLLALAEGVFQETKTATEARQFMSRVLDHFLDYRPLSSRQVMRELTQIKRAFASKS